MSMEDPFGAPVPGLPSAVWRVDRPTDIRAARQLVIGVATAFGLGVERCTGLATAVSEVAANALQHGGGSATIFAYDGEGAVIIDVHDQAATEIPAVPTEPPSVTSLRGRGLWLARQMCDRVEIMRHQTGNIVRLVMNL